MARKGDASGSMTLIISGERRFEDLAAAQAAFEAWREVYNAKRPHEALEHKTPASRYAMSPRAMPEVVEPPDYEPQAHVRVVRYRWPLRPLLSKPCSDAGRPASEHHSTCPRCPRAGVSLVSGS